jgi:hypothetical protein|tara:strand:- start:17 stop:271 length:255 start_codon:yes stop_codon:yes gene_type:complete
MQRVRTTFEFVGENRSITALSKAITFVVPSTGNPCRVNGFPINAGDSLEISLDEDDLDVTNYDVFFDSGTGSDELYVIRVIRVD